MERIPEKEIMDDAVGASGFDNANRKYSEDAFINWYKEYCNVDQGNIIDLGVGPGKYLIKMCEEFPNTTYIGYDASKAMLDIANNNIRNAGLEDRILVKQSFFNDITETSNCVISSGTLHHQHDPLDFWKTIKRIATKNLFIMDIVRPSSTSHARQIVEYLAKDQNEYFKTDFYNSLCAAFTVNEIKSQLDVAGLNLTVTVKGSPDQIEIVLVHGVLK